MVAGGFLCSGCFACLQNFHLAQQCLGHLQDPFFLCTLFNHFRNARRQGPSPAGRSGQTPHPSASSTQNVPSRRLFQVQLLLHPQLPVARQVRVLSVKADFKLCLFKRNLDLNSRSQSPKTSQCHEESCASTSTGRLYRFPQFRPKQT